MKNEMTRDLYRLIISGKTLMLYSLLLGQNAVVETQPTDGFNVEMLNIEERRYVMYDISGAENFQVKRRQFFQGSQVEKLHAIPTQSCVRISIVYIINGDASTSMDLVNNDITEITKNSFLDGLPILFIVSKQDIQGSKNEKEVIKSLNLLSMYNRRWKLFQASLTSQEDITSIRELIYEFFS